MVDLSLPLVVIGVDVVAFGGCVCTTAVVVGLWGIIVPLFWALPGIVPFCSTAIASDARTECCILGPIVEVAAAVLWSYYWNCWLGCYRPLKFIPGPVVANWC